MIYGGLEDGMLYDKNVAVIISLCFLDISVRFSLVHFTTKYADLCVELGHPLSVTKGIYSRRH